MNCTIILTTTRTKENDRDELQRPQDTVANTIQGSPIQVGLDNNPFNIPYKIRVNLMNIWLEKKSRKSLTKSTHKFIPTKSWS